MSFIQRKTNLYKMSNTHLLTARAIDDVKESKMSMSTHAEANTRAEANMRAKANARAGARNVAVGAREDLTIFSPHWLPAVGAHPIVKLARRNVKRGMY